MNATGNGNGNKAGEAVFRPAVDIIDTPTDVVLITDVAGVDESHLDVTLDKDMLTIRGNVEKSNWEGYRPVQMEYAVGNYERVFTVSDDVNREGIEATIKDGVLRLRLPKTTQSARRKINVVAR
jgi:HSP20 family molecular chaperone IbpA